MQRRDLLDLPQIRLACAEDWECLDADKLIAALYLAREVGSRAVTRP